MMTPNTMRRIPIILASVIGSPSRTTANITVNRVIPAVIKGYAKLTSALVMAAIQNKAAIKAATRPEKT